jgi:hypothetical protein
LLAALALAGCGGSSRHAEPPKALTVPAYAGYAPITIPVTEGTPELCRGDADAFTRNAVAFLKPSTSPPDQFYLSARLQFFDFKAHLCDADILREELARRLGPAQRRLIRGPVRLPRRDRARARAALVAATAQPDAPDGEGERDCAALSRA